MINLVFDAGHGQGQAHNRGYVGKRWKNEGDGGNGIVIMNGREPSGSLFYLKFRIS